MVQRTVAGSAAFITTSQSKTCSRASNCSAYASPSSPFSNTLPTTCRTSKSGQVAARRATRAQTSTLSLPCSMSSAVALGGVWGYRISERSGDHDERYHQIALRGGAISMWVFYWAVVVWSQVESNTDITTPILEPLTWLLAVPWVAFGVAYLYYTRVM